MKPYYEDDHVTLYHGDCLDVIAAMPDASVDSIVTDPPYGLGFMGKAWDDLPPGLPWAVECLRVLKPGGHLLAFGGTRTWHRLAVAVEDAGFEMRDSIAWLYGSGFPKSMDVGKAIDKAAGAEREVVGPDPNWRTRVHSESTYDGGQSRPEYITAPATPDAQRWDGWGTALKPAFEPIVVARKPLSGTVAQNVLTHGTGALNVDATRIGTTDSLGGGANKGMTAETRHEGFARPWMRDDEAREAAAARSRENTARAESMGRWPANVVLDGPMAAALDEQSGTSESRIGKPRGAASGDGWGMTATGVEYADSGGASRFFYTTKATSAERPFYWRLPCNCETIKPCAETSRQRDIGDSRSGEGKSWNMSTSGNATTVPSLVGTTSTTETATSSTTRPPTSSSSPSSNTSASIPAANCETASGGNPAQFVESSSQSTLSTGISAPKDGRFTGGAAPATSPALSGTSVCANCGASARRESHATVKPLDLMRWLVRLVTPPGGVVLDPFAGSGTTLEAAIVEGFRCIGIEREADYLPLIEQRIARACPPLDFTEATA